MISSNLVTISSDWSVELRTWPEQHAQILAQGRLRALALGDVVGDDAYGLTITVGDRPRVDLDVDQ
jgi:hypothetical protein